MTEQALSLSDWLEGRVAVGLDPALAGLLADIARPCTKISEEINRAGLADIKGLSGTTNVHGEEVKKLDLYSDQLIIDALRQAGSVCGMASEEAEEIITTMKGQVLASWEDAILRQGGGQQDCANISHAIVSSYPGFEYDVSS